ncbi:MAG: CHAT domain-containing protein [Acidobacteriota bacterium]
MAWLVREQQGRLRLVADGLGDDLEWELEQPLSEVELEDLRWYLEDFLQAPHLAWRERADWIREQLPAWGERVAAALLGPAVSRLPQDLSTHELWLCSSSPACLSVPWELARRPGARRPLCLELDRFGRALEPPGSALSLDVDGALRVLLVIARPSGVESLAFGSTGRRLLERAVDGGPIDLEVLRPPSFDALQRRLEEARAEGRPHHVVHFDGHGTFDESAGEAVLAFETRSGQHARVPAGKLAGVVGAAGVPLLVLSACQSGRIVPSVRPEASVAVSALRSGVASTVTMTTSVHAEPVAWFMDELYASLSSGEPVSRAVSSGRRCLQEAPERSTISGRVPLEDWLVPVHHASRDVVFEGLRARAPARTTETPFIGRDRDIQELERTLLRHRVVLLHGLVGVGKTSLARAFSRWFASTRGGAALSESWHRGGELPDGLLAELRQRPSVVTWDDFDSASTTDAQGLRELLAGLAGDAEGWLILTSRSPQHWLEDDIARHHVQGLTPPDVAAMLPAPPTGGDTLPTRRLLSLVDGHPSTLLALAPQLEQLEHDQLADGLAGSGSLPTEAGVLTDLGHELAEALETLTSEQQEALPALLLFEGIVDQSILEQLVESGASSLAGVQWSPLLRSCEELGLLVEVGQGAFRVHPALGARIAAGREAAVLDHREELVQSAIRAHGRLGKWLFGASLGDRRVAGRLAGEQFTLLRTARAAIFRNEHRNAQLMLQPLIRHWTAEGLFTSVLHVLEELRERVEEGHPEPDLGTELGDLWLYLNSEWAGRMRAVDSERAAAVYRELRQRLERDSRRPVALAAVRHQQGLLAQDDALLGEAEEHFRAARELCESAEDAAGLAAAHHQLGRLAEQRSDWPAAERSHLRSLELERGLRHQQGIASSLHQLGIVAQRAGDDALAQSRFLEAIQLKETLGDWAGVARIHHELGILSADVEQATAWHRRALVAARSLGERSLQAAACHQLGLLARKDERLTEATRWLRAAIELKERLGERNKLSSSLHEMGKVLQARGRLDQARQWYGRALALNEELGRRHGLAANHACLASLALEENRLDECLRESVRAVAFSDTRPGQAPAGIQELLTATVKLGVPELEKAWRECLGEELPDDLRKTIEAVLRELRGEEG